MTGPDTTVPFVPGAKAAELARAEDGWTLRYRDGSGAVVRTTSLTESLIDVGAGGSPAPPSVVEDRVEALLRAVGYATAPRRPAGRIVRRLGPHRPRGLRGAEGSSRDAGVAGWPVPGRRRAGSAVTAEPGDRYEGGTVAGGCWRVVAPFTRWPRTTLQTVVALPDGQQVASCGP